MRSYSYPVNTRDSSGATGFGNVDVFEPRVIVPATMKKNDNETSAGKQRRVLLAKVHSLLTTEYPTYEECENATNEVVLLLHKARRDGLLEQATSKGVTFDITIGAMVERTVISRELYERLGTFLAAQPHSLARLFEIGCVAVMAAFTGDETALRLIREDRPGSQVKSRARRKGRAPTKAKRQR